jgi:integrase
VFQLAAGHLVEGRGEMLILLLPSVQVDLRSPAEEWPIRLISSRQTLDTAATRQAFAPAGTRGGSPRQRRSACDRSTATANITAATLLLAQGVDQRVVMEILGHSQISMTSKYAHVLPQVMTDAADRIGQALWGSSQDSTATRTATNKPRRSRE